MSILKKWFPFLLILLMNSYEIFSDSLVLTDQNIPKEPNVRIVHKEDIVVDGIFNIHGENLHLLSENKIKIKSGSFGGKTSFGNGSVDFFTDTPTVDILGDVVTDVLVNVTAPQGAYLQFFHSLTSSSLGYFSANIIPDIEFDPNPGAVGTEEIFYRVSYNTDGLENFAYSQFLISANTVNMPPVFSMANTIIVHTQGLQPVTIQNFIYNIKPGPDYESSQTTEIVFQYDHPEFFSVQPILSSDNTLTYTPNRYVDGISNITITVRDNGDSFNNSVNYSSQDFYVVIDTKNKAPSFLGGDDVAATIGDNLEIYPQWAKEITAGQGEDSYQTKWFEVSTDHDEYFEQTPSIIVEGNTGTLSFKPKHNIYSDINVTVILKDNGGSDYQGKESSVPVVFNIFLDTTNKKPSFTKGSDISASGNAFMLRNYPTWATNIMAGPPEESDQQLNFILNINDEQQRRLFIEPPSINRNGDLSFSANIYVHGTADVEVLLQDEGGGFGGNVNRDKQFFIIEVQTLDNAPRFTMVDTCEISTFAAIQIANFASNIQRGPQEEAEREHLHFVMSNDSPDFFVTQPSISDNGTLDFQLHKGQQGTLQATVTLYDDGDIREGGGNQLTLPVTFNVNTLNNAPSFELPKPRQYFLEEPNILVKDFVLNVIAGPPDEQLAQKTWFAITYPEQYQGYFSKEPTISDNGILSMQVASSLPAEFDMMITLWDDGGHENDGIDHSEPYIFRFIYNFYPISRTDTVNLDNGKDAYVYKVLDNDEDHEPISIREFFDGQLGTVEWLEVGNFHYARSIGVADPDPMPDHFVYVVEDIYGANVQTLVNITVNPFAAMDNIFLNEDSTEIFDVLANDHDLDGHALSLKDVITQPLHGKVSFETSGNITYTPQTDFFGSDNLSYLLEDSSGAQSVGWVNLNILDVNDPPVVVDDVVTIDPSLSGNLSVYVNVFSNDYDPENNPLSVVESTLPAHMNSTYMGIGVFKIDLTDVTISFVDAFDVIITDGHFLRSSHVIVQYKNDNGLNLDDLFSQGSGIIISHGPLVIKRSQITDELVVLQSYGEIVLEDFSIDANSIFRASVVGDSSATDRIRNFTMNENKTLSVNVHQGIEIDQDIAVIHIDKMPNDGLLGGKIPVVQYSPNAFYFGQDGFHYSVSNNFVFVEGVEVAIQVNGINDPPELQTAVLPIIAEDAGPVVIGDWIQVLNAGHGEYFQTVSTLVTVTGNSQILSEQLRLSGNDLLFATNSNAYGDINFNVSVTENEGSLPLSTTKSFTLTIQSVNDAPVIASTRSYQVSEDQPFSINAAGGVLQSATDVDQDQLQAVLVTPPAHGQLTLEVDGSFTYIPELNFDRKDVFTVKAFDGTMSSSPMVVTLDVVGSQDPPSAFPDRYAFSPMGNLMISVAEGVLKNDSDPDQGTTLTATLTSNVHSGRLEFFSDGSFHYFASGSWAENTFFTYQLSDGLATTSSTVFLDLLGNADLPLDIWVDALNVDHQRNVADLRARAPDTGESGGSIAWTWTSLSGPGELFFSSDNTSATSVMVDRSGFYDLKVTAQYQSKIISKNLTLRMEPVNLADSNDYPQLIFDSLTSVSPGFSENGNGRPQILRIGVKAGNTFHMYAEIFDDNPSAIEYQWTVYPKLTSLTPFVLSGNQSLNPSWDNNWFKNSIVYLQLKDGDHTVMSRAEIDGPNVIIVGGEYGYANLDECLVALTQYRDTVSEIHIVAGSYTGVDFQDLLPKGCLVFGEGDVLLTPNSSTGVALAFSNTSNIKFEGLQFDGMGLSMASPMIGGLLSNCNHIIFNNCSFSRFVNHSDAVGLKASTTSLESQVDLIHCHFENNSLNVLMNRVVVP